MIFSVYLHQEYQDYLSCYGDINDVTDRILQKLRTTDIDIESLPNAPSRDNAKRLNINVTDNWYLEEAKSRPRHSPTFSLRKILYFAVDNELPAMWGWKVSTTFCNKREKDILKHIDNALTHIEHATHLASGYMSEQLDDVFMTLQNIRNQYKQ